MPEFQPVLVIPVYQHGVAFSVIFPKLLALGVAMIIVDDGSGPETRDILQGLSSGRPDVHLQRHSQNQGKGAAVATGLKLAASLRFSHALQIDADGQHDLADVPALLAAAESQPLMVVVGRPLFDQSMPRARRIGRWFTHVWIWVETLSLDIQDSMCGFRVYPLQRVGPLLEVRGLGRRMDFDPEILVRLHWQGTKPLAVPTKVIYPADGTSNFLLLQDNLLITAMHIRLVLGMLLRLPTILGRRLRGPDAS